MKGRKEGREAVREKGKEGGRKEGSTHTCQKHNLYREMAEDMDQELKELLCSTKTSLFSRRKDSRKFNRSSVNEKKAQ
jgi:hypothetical protein